MAPMPRPSSADRQIAYAYAKRAAPHLSGLEMSDVQVRTWKAIAELDAIGDWLGGRDESIERPVLTLIRGGLDA